MADVASFVDVEGWLTANLTPGCPVGTKPPTPRPSRFVRVLVLGGPGRANRISETVTVSIESYDSTETAAQQLAQANRDQINGWQGRNVGGAHIKTVTEDSRPGNLPHPTIPGARYVQQFSIHLRGTL